MDYVAVEGDVEVGALPSGYVVLDIPHQGPCSSLERPGPVDLVV